MEIKPCPKCGEKVSVNAKFCENCGAIILSEEKIQKLKELEEENVQTETSPTYEDLIEEWKHHSSFSRFVSGAGYIFIKILKIILTVSTIGFALIYFIFGAFSRSTSVVMGAIRFSAIAITTCLLFGDFLDKLIYILVRWSMSKWLKEKGFSISKMYDVFATFPQYQKTNKVRFFSLKFDFASGVLIQSYIFSKSKKLRAATLSQEIIILLLKILMNGCACAIFLMEISSVSSILYKVSPQGEQLKGFGDAWGVVGIIFLDVLKNPLTYVMLCGFISKIIVPVIITKIIRKETEKIAGEDETILKEKQYRGMENVNILVM